MAGDAAQGVSPRIVNLTAHPPSFTLFRWRIARGIGLGLRFELSRLPVAKRLPQPKAKGGVLHSQRAEDSLRGEAVERLLRDRPHDLSQHLVADVGIHELGPGRIDERLPVFSCEDLFGCPGVELDRIVWRKPRAMGQELLEGDLVSVPAS